MNVDDPRLTAYALGELSEAEREEIKELLSESPETQQFVNETQDFARVLRSEYRNDRIAEKPANLIDIRDDPWFWSVARPLAIAAVITLAAIIGAITIAKYKARTESNTASAVTFAIDGEEKPQTEGPSVFAGPESVKNPVPANVVQRIQDVVIGELDPASPNGEVRVIETIRDAYRTGHLKQRLTTPILSKSPHRGRVGGAYELLFVDRDGHVIASASFYRNSDLGFVLQPSKYGYQRDGHYFVRGGDAVLPGDWEPGVNYSGYVIPFSNWIECVGYSPGV